jgi:hypothetical protein
MLIAAPETANALVSSRGTTMVRFEITRNELVVSGRLKIDDVDLLVDWGRGLLDSGTDEIVLDLRGAEAPSKTFVGAVAQIAMCAHTKSKTLLVKATGRTADWLVWSGLHRVARLEVQAPCEGIAIEPLT